MRKKLALAMLLLMPTLVQADMSGSTERMLIAYGERQQDCFKCIARTFNRVYEPIILAPDQYTAESIIKNNADPNNPFIGVVCLQVTESSSSSDQMQCRELMSSKPRGY